MSRYASLPRTSLLVLLLSLVLLAPVAAIEIMDIRVQTLGGTRMDSAFVLLNTQTKVGSELSRIQLAEDIRRLQGTRRFTHVRAEFEEVEGGIRLVYMVQARANLRNFTIRGNEKVGKTRIRKLMGINRGDLVDDTTVGIGVAKIREEYKKRYFPRPEVQTQLEIDPDTGAADLVLTVNEGVRQRVDDITFTGNQFFNAREIREVMKQKQDWNWYMKPVEIFKKRGHFDSAAIKKDLDAIRYLYQGEGFLDVEVGQPEFFHDGAAFDHLEVRIPIIEGPRYRIGQLTIEGVTEYPVQQMYQILSAKPRGHARLIDLNRSRQTLRDYYGSRGYIGTGVTMKIDPRSTGHVVDVHYQVFESRLAKIRNIIIRGNAVTHHSVIRRELTFFSNDVYNDVRVRNSERRLRNTRLFDYVKAIKRPTAVPDEYDVIIDVHEGPSGSVMAGFAFSSIDSIVGFVQLSQNNFNLRGPPYTGGGQKLSLRATLGTERDSLDLTHVEPWFLNQKLRLTTKAYRNQWRFLSDDYDQQRVGGSIGLSKPIAELWRGSLTYGLEEISVDNVSSDASEVIQAEEGSNIKSSLTATLRRESRDRSWLPTKGNRTTLSVGYAGGPVGFDVDIMEYSLRSQHHWPILKDHVLSVKGHLRTVDPHGDEDRVRLFDRLFNGGPRTIRAFGFRDVGPKDASGEPIGGRSDWQATAEYSIPIAEAMRLATFYDVGMVEEGEFDWDFGNRNSGVGIGIRLDIPQFPIQFNYAWPLEADEFNDRSSPRLNFMFGSSF